ncbi:HNH endonuclease [Mycobacterium phage Ritam007]|nr:HNH endonuclease [Mycobacterium phage Saroj]UZV39559.1 HNH endonuclease [Mycobacterium phage Ritam007]
MVEAWLPVVGYEGLYEVSDGGRVRSLDRQIECDGRGRRYMRGRVLSQSVMPNGYLKVGLPGGNALVHRLVLTAFVGACPDGMEGCHNDGDRSNNRLDNLRWDSRTENNHDAVRHRTNWQSKKTTCPKGHDYDGVFYRPSTRRPMRYCKTCRNERARARYAKRLTRARL